MEKEEGVEEVERRRSESLGSHSRAGSGESERNGDGEGRRIIRFEEGDPEDPNNCKLDWAMEMRECVLTCVCNVGSRVWLYSYASQNDYISVLITTGQETLRAIHSAFFKSPISS